MSFNETRRQSAQIIGNVTTPRNIMPTLRTSKRRTDPDIDSTIPYYPSLSGKSLTLQYTDSSYVEQEVIVSFSSDGYSSAIAAISAADEDNLEAVDQDGFLAIRNINSGGRHFLRVSAGTAANVLGLAIDPEPGSVSYAGEFSSTPGVRSQKNPQGTALLGRDEDLTSAAINRAISTVLQHSDLLKVDLDREVVGFISCPVSIDVREGVTGFYLDMPTSRIPVNARDLGEAIPGILDPFFEFTDAYDQTLYGESFQKMTVVNVYYYEPGTPMSNAHGFDVWGEPDGFSVYQPAISYKTKHAAVAITSIVGGVVYCPGATFSAKYVQKCDPVLIQGATNTSPFDHNGWFVVDEVIDTEHLLLRPMSVNESIPTGAPDDVRPSELNPTGTGFGNLSVHIGNFIPISTMFFEVNIDAGIHPFPTVRMAVGMPFRSVLLDYFSYGKNGNQNNLGLALYQHIGGVGYKHDPDDINGFTSATLWKDGSTITGSDLKATIENILTDLSNINSGQAGTRKVGGDDILISGSPPNNLIAASLRDQLVDLLTKLQTHVLDGTAHAGGSAIFTKNPASPVQLWKDGTTVADGITIVQAITNIVTALGGNPGLSDGASKINTGARTSWLGGRTNPANVSVLDALTKIITDLAATTAADDGAERVGAATMTEAGQTICGDSLRTQLNYLATLWGKTNRTNIWDATQTLNGPGGDPGQTNAAILTNTSPLTDRKLLWEIGAGTISIRFYSCSSFSLEITVNARRYTTGGLWYWKRDSDTYNSAKYVFERNSFSIYHRDAGSTVWDDYSWTRIPCNLSFSGSSLALFAGDVIINDSWKYINFANGFYQQMGGNNPTGVLSGGTFLDYIPTSAFSQTDYNGRICAKNTIKGWVSFKISGAGSGSYWLAAEQAFNISTVSMVNSHTIRIVTNFSFSDNNYVPIFQLMDNSSTAACRSLKMFIDWRGPNSWETAFVDGNGNYYDMTVVGRLLRVLCMVIGVA